MDWRVHRVRLAGVVIVCIAAPIAAVVAAASPGRHLAVTHPLVTYQGYAGTAIISADGRTLVVGPYGLDCGSRVTVVALEGVAKVALFLQYTPAGHCNPGEGAMPLV
jgi:hypothetical protein